MIMKNKKGISLSITAIVIIAVGLVVMLVVLGYFVGGFTRTGSTMSNVTSVAEAETSGADLGTRVGQVADVWKKKFGEDCDTDADCASGNCLVGGTCGNPT